jgi:type IV secretion system protein VirB9
VALMQKIRSFLGRLSLLYAIMAAFGFSVCWAQGAIIPEPGVGDPRVRTAPYDPEGVVRLTGHFGYQIVVEFAADEKIENVALGDSIGWQVTPNRKGSLLFIKPVDAQRPTNMTVVTTERRYSFELVPDFNQTPGPQDLIFSLRFRYPAAKPVEAAEQSNQKPDIAQALVVSPTAFNFRYSFSGSRRNVPERVFDDGRFTYFQWPERAQTPAVFIASVDGKSESIVNYAIRDGFLVIEQTAPLFILRQGKEVTRVFNDQFQEPDLGSQAPKPRNRRAAR